MLGFLFLYPSRQSICGLEYWCSALCWVLFINFCRTSGFQYHYSNFDLKLDGILIANIYSFVKTCLFANTLNTKCKWCLDDSVYIYTFISTHKEIWWILFIRASFYNNFTNYRILFFVKELYLFYLFCGPLKLPSFPSGFEMTNLGVLPNGLPYDSFIYLKVMFLQEFLLFYSLIQFTKIITLLIQTKKDHLVFTINSQKSDVET